jgi:hypothetical protein
VIRAPLFRKREKEKKRKREKEKKRAAAPAEAATGAPRAGKAWRSRKQPVSQETLIYVVLIFFIYFLRNSGLGQ